MAIRVMADNNIDIPSRMDAINYNISQGYAPHIISKTYGYGDGARGLEVISEGLKAPIFSGAATVYGYTIISDASDTLTNIPTNSTGYICLTLDLSQPPGKEGRFEFVTALKQENLLNNGTIYNIPLAKITTDSSTIKMLEDVRFKNLTSKGGLYFESQQNGKVDIKNTATNEKIGCNYVSKDEIFTGEYRWDGKKIYSKTYELRDTIPANTWVGFDLPSGALTDTVTIDYNNTYYVTRSVCYPANYYENENYKFLIMCDRARSKIAFKVGAQMANSWCFLTARYCKDN